MDRAKRLFEKLAISLDPEQDFRDTVTRFAQRTVKKDKKLTFAATFKPGKADVFILNKGRKGFLGIGKKKPSLVSFHRVSRGTKPGTVDIESRLRKTADLTIEKLAVSEQLVLRAARHAFEAKKFDQQIRLMKAYKTRKKNLGGMFRLPSSKLKQTGAANRKYRNEVTLARNRSRHSLSKDLKGVYNI